MINQVYTTVLAILNKDNRGYVSPMEFNLYSELAQLSIFEELFHKYAKSLVKQNNRMYNSEFSDIPKHIREVFDIFSDEVNLVEDANGFFFYDIPNFYKGIKIEINNGDQDFYGRFEVEEVSKLEINKLINNNIIAPTEEYPVYIRLNDKYKLFPEITYKRVIGTYVRKPNAPKWTYVDVSGNPLFNPSAADYTDFEIPSQFFYDLVVKILGYCGIEIRENDVVQISQAMEMANVNNEQL